MKVGLIGNMNNNNFSLMRYFRDLGVDAHLLLYANDGKEALSHFTPEADTWNIDKWSPFIHQTIVPNSVISALESPLSWLLAIRYKCRLFLGFQENYVSSISNKALDLAYGEYDLLVGSGITPATLLRIDRYLDIYYPYSPQVEFLFAGWFVKKITKRKFLLNIHKKVQEKQKVGIQKAKHVLNFEPGVTEDALNSIGIQSKRLSIPMVYNREKHPAKAPSEMLSMAASQMEKSSFTVFHHARLMWERQLGYTAKQWRLHNKNNNWLIEEFAKLTKIHSNSAFKLFLVEYGPDIDAAKKLIAKLGIEKYVTWLPKMKRKEILWLIERVSIVSGEFYDVKKMIWGGTGWEALASGRPFLQAFHFSEGEFEEIFGYPPPPILQVKEKGDILKHFLDVLDNPKKISLLADVSKQWFETYNGNGIARQWLSLLHGKCSRKN